MPGSANISGTANRLVKFTGNASGGDSVITELAGSIGIRTAAPQVTLDITSPTAGSALHVGTQGIGGGAYLAAPVASSAILAGGASFDGQQWVARATEAGILQTFQGTFAFASRTGQTIGSTIDFGTPRMVISNSGRVGVNVADPQALMTIGDQIPRFVDGTDDLVVKDGIDANSVDARYIAATGPGVALKVSDGVANHALEFFGDPQIACVTKGCTMPNQSGWLKVKVDGTIKYMPLFD